MMRATLIFLMLTAVRASASDTIQESTILGNWCAGSKTSFHEEFTLSIEDGVRVFSSWLHQRPAESGTWELADRTLSIRSAGDVTVYRIVSATRNRLIMQQPEQPREVYVRKGCVPFESPPRQ